MEMGSEVSESRAGNDEILLCEKLGINFHDNTIFEYI